MVQITGEISSPTRVNSKDGERATAVLGEQPAGNSYTTLSMRLPGLARRSGKDTYIVHLHRPVPGSRSQRLPTSASIILSASATSVAPAAAGFAAGAACAADEGRIRGARAEAGPALGEGRERALGAAAVPAADADLGTAALPMSRAWMR